MKKITLEGFLPILSFTFTEDLAFLIVGGTDGELTVLTDPESSLSILKKQWQAGTILGSVS